MTLNNRKLLCPICKKPADNKFKPFCSFRCKQIDLYKWLNESYRIPTNEYSNNNNNE